MTAVAAATGGTTALASPVAGTRNGLRRGCDQPNQNQQGAHAQKAH